MLTVTQEDTRLAIRICEGPKTPTEVSREIARYRQQLGHDDVVLSLLRDSPALPYLLNELKDRFERIKRTPSREEWAPVLDKLRLYERLIVLLGGKVRRAGRPPNYLKSDRAS